MELNTTSLIAVACGGAIGAVARYAFSTMIGSHGVLIANVFGCFLIGVLLTLIALKTSVNQTTHLFLTVGLLGGFTTFSTFSVETMGMIDTQKYAQAAFYILISVGGGVGAFIFGRFLVKTVL
ncbi:MAG: fluoride efflux transporter CrcB [Alphaproteobacteria bacterium]|nr:MAG: fluoride efflux transporter CrcB [Alphaproteobacteria bacterium]